jgi:hypothetical protein
VSPSVSGRSWSITVGCGIAADYPAPPVWLFCSTALSTLMCAERVRCVMKIFHETVKSLACRGVHALHVRREVGDPFSGHDGALREM